MAGPPRTLVRVTSPVALALAGRRWFPVWAMLRHRGRKSGIEREVPVAVIATDEAFVIGLPWGPRTNWARNVLAAGGATIRWKGREHVVTSPRLVERSTALAAARGPLRFAVSRAPIEDFIELRRG